MLHLFPFTIRIDTINNKTNKKNASHCTRISQRVICTDLSGRTCQKCITSKVHPFKFAFKIEMTNPTN